MDSLPQTIKPMEKKGPRSSVSAEAFGTWNKKEDFKARVIEKSEDTKGKILHRLKMSFLFSSLSDNEIKIVVDAMEEKKYSQG